MQSEPSTSQLLIADRIGAVGHHVPEAWLRSRVRGWVDQIESPWCDYWIGTYTAEGRWIHCSSKTDTWAPNRSKQDYAMKVCAHLNRQTAADGAWLTGWLLDGQRFYLLWKDKDGDIQIPIECDKPFSSIRDWAPLVWETHAVAALGIWSEHHKNQEYAMSQGVKRAQGERTSSKHLSEGLRVAGLT